ncbi:MAG: AIR carboxylase family protein [Sphingomonadales bacterium]|nr:AIR carboxylase family protein [Sphingomonadales bacterium]
MVKVGVIMGSRSDWETMRHAAEVLEALDIPHECKVVSAHRTPDRLVDLSGMDSLLSIVQMPGGIPVGTLAIGKAGATNAGLLAAAILANHDSALAERLEAWRARQTQSVAEEPE